MTSGGNIAVIDIGKTNAKVVLVDPNTMEEITVEKTRNKVINSKPYPHFDVDRIWSFILGSLRKLQAAHGISAISITAHGACAALLNENGSLATPILDYEHHGVDQTAAIYDKTRPKFTETGSPRLAGGLNLGAQIFWLFETMEGLKDRTDTILMYPQYWAQRLTGISANEVTSLGCHTDLWNPYTNDFSSMVDELVWREKFAPVRAANQVLGPISKMVADKTGLSIDTLVYCGIHDSNASLYPYILSQDDPFSVVSSGTWVIAMSVGGEDIELSEDRDTLINVNALGQKVPSARFMGGREFEILCDGRNNDYDQADIISVLQSQAMLLPSVEPTSGPFAGRKMQWTCDPDALTDGEHTVVASFYLALMTHCCLKLIGACGTIFVEGTFAENDAYVAMLEAATGRQVVVSEGTGTSQGAALLVGGGSKASSQKVIGKLFEHPKAIEMYGKNWIDLVSTPSESQS